MAPWLSEWLNMPLSLQGSLQILAIYIAPGYDILFVPCNVKWNVREQPLLNNVFFCKGFQNNVVGVVVYCLPVRKRKGYRYYTYYQWEPTRRKAGEYYGRNCNRNRIRKINTAWHQPGHSSGHQPGHQPSIFLIWLEMVLTCFLWPKERAVRFIARTV